MKTLLRSAGLVALLALTILALPGRATSPYGTCRAVCIAPLGVTPLTVVVTWQTTQSDCCNPALNPPCPTGYRASSRAYEPPNGAFALCTMNN
jgi:hypothetical protein